MSLKIILADDSLTAQNMGRKILAEAGFEVIAVSNGAQAMKKIVSDKPDLVVLDVYMPGYSGLELCERLRNTRETARTPVVLTVGKMEAFKAEEVNRVGADGLIVKPFEATELVAVVKKLAESLAPATRPKRQEQTESAAKKPVEAEPEPPSEPELEVQHHAMQVPAEIASEPVSGMYFLTPEEQAAAAPAPQPEPAAAPPIEFEVEREEPVAKVEPGPRMASAHGFSGVFEMEPTAHPAVETPAEAAPAEEIERFTAAVPDEPQPVRRSAADEGATTIAHEFDTFEPEHEPKSNGDALRTENAFSAAPVETSLPSFAQQFDQAQAEPVIEGVNAPLADVLPELTSWDEPLPAASSQSSWESEPPSPEILVAEPSAAELAATGSVWVAEETEIEPHESAISLHEQMQRGCIVDELPGSEPATPPANAESAFETWEAPEALSSEAVYPENNSPEPCETEILQHFEPNRCAEPPAAADLTSGAAQEGADFSVEFMAAAESEPAAKPAPTLDPEPYAASELEPEPPPPLSVPVVSEVAADPIRVARIVEEALERLKPELIAAVTRELAKKD